MRIRPWLSLALGLVLATGAWPLAMPATAAQDAAPPVRNVILMIGDGMGLPIVGAAELASRQHQGRSLALTRLYQEGAMGLAYTGSADAMITDSAAAATTLATGVKTRNGYVGMGPDGQDLLTVSEAAMLAGKRVGLVTNTRITHATPAAFSAVQRSRDEENAIAEQQLDSGIDLLLGGGARHYLPREIAGSRRQDDRDLVSEAWSKGYQVVRTRDELLSSDADKLLGLFHLDHLTYQIDNPQDTEPSLAEMTSKALDVLNRHPKGFFLMVEGGKIDHALHSNDGAAAIAELFAFDDAIAAAWDFQKKNPETLLIVTADHDTGGFTIVGQQRADKPRSIRYPDPEALKVLDQVERSFDSMLPALSQAKSVAEVQAILKTHAGIDVEREWVERLMASRAWMRSFNYHETAAIAAGEQHVLPFGFTTSSHTASPVLIGAVGPQPYLERLQKPQENAEIGRLLIEVMGRR